MDFSATNCANSQISERPKTTRGRKKGTSQCPTNIGPGSNGHGDSQTGLSPFGLKYYLFIKANNILNLNIGFYFLNKNSPLEVEAEVGVEANESAVETAAHPQKYRKIIRTRQTNRLRVGKTRTTNRPRSRQLKPQMNQR